ncbi:MAG: hypothetical protein IAE78_30390 [Myxococcus sp.]|nr:hypothetical protein [Myxococcus sp.]
MRRNAPSRGVWLLAALVSGCVVTTVLRPAPGAVVVPQQPNVLFTEVADVRVWAGGAWVGDPPGLADVLTPVHVAFENRSARPLRVSYRDCTLVGRSGFRYAALPPFPTPPPVGAVERTGEVVLADYHPATPVPKGVKPRPVHPRAPPSRFFIAPPYVGWYPGIVVWPHPWHWHVHYAPLYATWQVPLPTHDMLERALPEGVLQPGGRVSGFLYFQRVERESAVTLEVQLVDAESAQPMGVAQLPFLVAH